MNFKDLCCKYIPMRLYRRRFENKYGNMFRNWSDEDREKYLDIMYFKRFGVHIDFENPVSFTEKMQYYKLYYHTPELKNIVCKYHFKQYIADKVGEGYTIPLLGAWTDVDAVDFDALPEKFVFKSNCCSGGRCIKVIQNKSACDPAAAREELRSWLDPRNTLINSLCHAYYEVTPMIIAEEYKEEVDGQLYDYKFYCFDGVPYCVAAIKNRFTENGYELAFYDLNWNPIHAQSADHHIPDIEKPRHYEEMIRLAGMVSEGIPFVRVDFFDTEEQLYFAEMTFYPAGGMNPIRPYSFNLELGSRFRLPAKNVTGTFQTEGANKS